MRFSSGFGTNLQGLPPVGYIFRLAVENRYIDTGKKFERLISMPIYFTKLIRHGMDCLNTAPPPALHRFLYPQGLSLGTYNIRDSWGFSIAQSTRAVQISGFDLMVLTETNISDQSY